MSVDSEGRIHNYGHDQKGAELAMLRARDLAFSNSEIEYLHAIIKHHMRIHSAVHAKKVITGKSIYRFFRETRSAGIDICLLSLADTLATYEDTLLDSLWQLELDNCKVLLEAWWEKPSESIHPPRLLNGDDLMLLFGLKPGKLIGKLLTRLNEAQAAGEIKTRQEAMDFIQKQVNSSNPDIKSDDVGS